MATPLLVGSQGDLFPHLDRRTAELYARRLWRRIARLPETVPPQHLGYILGELAIAHCQVDRTEHYLEILWRFHQPEWVLASWSAQARDRAGALEEAATSRSASTRFSRRRRTAAA